MKTKKKPTDIKTKIQAEKERERRIATSIFLTFILLLVIFSAYITHDFPNPSQTQTTDLASFQLKAAIVDQLSLTFPNETFVQEAETILAHADYCVDYYEGKQVSVDFYRNLPRHEYNLIIFRVHSALRDGKPPVSLFTSEQYSTSKYILEQLRDELGIVAFSTSSREDKFFSIHAGFIRNKLSGRFQDTVVIMMGCNGLTYDDMARAFIEKGAGVYIGWNSSIVSSRTDCATLYLLERLVAERQPIRQAIYNTMMKIGLTQAYNSILGFFPQKAGDKTVE